MMMKLMINSWLPSIMAFSHLLNSSTCPVIDKIAPLSHLAGASGAFWTFESSRWFLNHSHRPFSQQPLHFPTGPTIAHRDASVHGRPGAKGEWISPEILVPPMMVFWGKLHGIFQGKSWDSKFAESRFWQF